MPHRKEEKDVKDEEPVSLSETLGNVRSDAGDIRDEVRGLVDDVRGGSILSRRPIRDRIRRMFRRE